MDALESAVTRLQERLTSAAALATVLAAAFDTFEQIRVCALAWQAQRSRPGR